MKLFHFIQDVSKLDLRPIEFGQSFRQFVSKLLNIMCCSGLSNVNTSLGPVRSKKFYLFIDQGLNAEFLQNIHLNCLYPVSTRVYLNIITHAADTVYAL